LYFQVLAEKDQINFCFNSIQICINLLKMQHLKTFLAPPPSSTRRLARQVLSVRAASHPPGCELREMWWTRFMNLLPKLDFDKEKKFVG
jgi:hypothetical protein